MLLKIVKCNVKSKFNFFSAYALEVKNNLLSRNLNLLGTLTSCYEKENQVFKVVPEESICTSCAEPLTVNGKKKGFILTNVIFKCTVFIYICSTCNKKYEYQGEKHSMLNYDNRFIISFEILKQYLDTYSINGTPLSCFLESRYSLAQLEDPVIVDSVAIKHYFGMLHHAFVSASVNLELNNTKCCESPKFITMDGVVISVKSKNIPQFDKPWITETLTKRATDRKDRQLEPLTEEEAKIIARGVASKKITEAHYNILKRSQKIPVKVFAAMCVRETNEYVVPEKLTFFGNFLLKKVAAVATMLPRSCLNIVQR